MGGYFEEAIRSLLDLPTVDDVRGRKFMIGIGSVADKETGELFPFETMLAIARLIMPGNSASS